MTIQERLKELKKQEKGWLKSNKKTNYEDVFGIDQLNYTRARIDELENTMKMNRGITFNQYLEVKLHYLNRAIKFLKSASLKELRENGFDSKKEAKQMLRFQLNEKKDVLKMLKFEGGKK
jgi:hypothetical protein